MLMMPITPKVMARPIAASSSTEPSETPYQQFCSACQMLSIQWMELAAAAAALFTAGEASGAAAIWFTKFRASPSPRAFSVAMAESRSSSVPVPEAATIAALAWRSAAFTPGSVSFAMAASTAPACLGS